MKITVDTQVFDTPRATDYFTKADHRILCGCRATLEMLDIPLPDWAQRKPTGPKPGRAIMAAFRADNPETLYEATMRKSAEHTARLPASSNASALYCRVHESRPTTLKAATPARSNPTCRPPSASAFYWNNLTPSSGCKKVLTSPNRAACPTAHCWALAGM